MDGIKIGIAECRPEIWGMYKCTKEDFAEIVFM